MDHVGETRSQVSYLCCDLYLVGSRAPYGCVFHRHIVGYYVGRHRCGETTNFCVSSCTWSRGEHTIYACVIGCSSLLHRQPTTLTGTDAVNVYMDHFSETPPCRNHNFCVSICTWSQKKSILLSVLSVTRCPLATTG